MNAADVMVSNVITVGPTATVQEVAATLLRHRISAVPVLDDKGALLGIVSEGDLMRRSESGTERRRSPWLELFASKETAAAEYVKSHSRKVTDVMTRRVVTASPETPLAELAGLLEKNAIKRVPILRNGKLVGIVSRANLLQALASFALPAAPAMKNDGAIRQQVMGELNSKTWATPALINVIVQDGAVELWGIVDSQVEKSAVRVLAETTPGVRAVKDNLTIHPMMVGT
jgi:CBS domain-containing protein